MSKKKTKIDVSGDVESLTSNPFAAISGMVPDELPQQDNEAKEPSKPKKDESPFKVARTRKGGWPITFEKRAKGKKVTVIKNITGDINALLKILRKHCGAGGVAKDGIIELQGNHMEKVEDFLKK